MSRHTYTETLALPPRPAEAQAIVLVLGGHRSQLLAVRMAVQHAGERHDLTVDGLDGRSIYVAMLGDLDLSDGTPLDLEVEYRGDPPPIGGLYYDSDVLHELRASTKSFETFFLPVEPSKAPPPDTLVHLLRAFFDGATGIEPEPFPVPSYERRYLRRRQLAEERHANATTLSNAQQVAADRRLRHDLFFLELDERTDPKNVGRVLGKTILNCKDAFQHRNWRRARYASEGLTAEFLKGDDNWQPENVGDLDEIRELLRDLLRSPRLTATAPVGAGNPDEQPRAPGPVGCQHEQDLVAAIRSAFESFAIGELHVLGLHDPARPEPDAELVAHGAPNGTAYFYFGEAASYYALACDQRAEAASDDPAAANDWRNEADFWREMLKIFADTAEVVSWLFWSGSARTFTDYAWNFYGRQRITRDIWKNRRHANACIPGRECDIEEWFSDLSLAAFRDTAYVASSGFEHPPTAYLRALQSRADRPLGTADYKPVAPPRIEPKSIRKQAMTTELPIRSPHALRDQLKNGKHLQEIPNDESAPAGVHADAFTIAKAFYSIAEDQKFKKFDIDMYSSKEHLGAMMKRLDEMRETNAELKAAMANAEVHQPGTLEWNYSTSDWEPYDKVGGAWCPFRIKNDDHAKTWCYWLGFSLKTS